MRNPAPRSAGDHAASIAPATAFAATLLTRAVQLGLTDLVLCPGSRSQALALVAAALEARDRIRLHVRIDERSAGFFALGLARETGRPVPVVTTSGTAVANLAPAMLEAFHAGIPLVALTADRPEELLGIGANQATVQPGLFGERVTCVAVAAPSGAADEASEARALADRLMETRGPLHVNVAFRDPLSSALPDLDALLGADAGAEADACGHAQTTSDAGATATSETHPPQHPPHDTVAHIDPADGVPTLVIAGDLAGPAAEEAAHAGGWPLIAEASSGARFGRNLVVAARELLGPGSPEPELRDAVTRVLVFGHPTLTREIPALIARPGVEAITVGSAGGEPYNPGHAVARHVDRVEIGPARADAPTPIRPAIDPKAWLRDWVRASHAIVAARSSDAAAPDLASATSTEPAERGRFARAELEIARQAVDRELLVDAVWRATWPHDRLVLGASRLIRVLDGRVPGKHIRVHANRGLAGIDGTIATGLGVAVGSQFGGSASDAIGVTRVLLGDLTLLHDIGSLLVGQGGEAAPRMQVIVGNDGGGTIFDGLEVAAIAGEAVMNRVQYTPQRAELEHLARGFGWHYVRATTRAELEGALSSHEHPRVVIEVPLPR